MDESKAKEKEGEGKTEHSSRYGTFYKHMISCR